MDDAREPIVGPTPEDVHGQAEPEPTPEPTVEDEPFPVKMVRKINFPNEMNLSDYQQGNIGEVILELLTGPDVNVYTSKDRNWCLPLTKYEIAMYLLEVQHLDFLRQRLLGIPMTDRQFFDLFFLLCAAPGRYRFEPVFNPERFADMDYDKIYTALTRIKPPRAYNLNPQLRILIYEYFQKGPSTVLYYFLIYSRRFIYSQEYFDKLHELRDRNKDYIGQYFTTNPDYAFPQLSIDNNHPAMLMIEYYQNYSPHILGKYSTTSADLVKGLGLYKPQHKTRHQLVKMYKYFRKDILGILLPHFVIREDGQIAIEYLDDLQNINVVDKNVYQSDEYFTYYVSALTSKMKSITNKEGQLDVLTSIYNNYKYGIEFLYLIMYTDILNRKKFLEGLAAYHLLYQCMTGRTAKYFDGPKQNLSEKPMLESLRQIIEKCARSCPLLRTIPFYRDARIVQRVYPLRDILSELNNGYIETDEIDNTIAVICSSLEVDIIEYARMINRIIRRLKLRDYYGIIKTSFAALNDQIDKVHIKKMYKKINIIADFQGRNALVIDIDYDHINAQLVLEDVPETNEEINTEDEIPIPNNVDEREITEDYDVYVE